MAGSSQGGSNWALVDRAPVAGMFPGAVAGGVSSCWPGCVQLAGQDDVLEVCRATGLPAFSFALAGDDAPALSGGPGSPRRRVPVSLFSQGSRSVQGSAFRVTVLSGRLGLASLCLLLPRRAGRAAAVHFPPFLPLSLFFLRDYRSAALRDAGGAQSLCCALGRAPAFPQPCLGRAIVFPPHSCFGILPTPSPRAKELLRRETSAAALTPSEALP